MISNALTTQFTRIGVYIFNMKPRAGIEYLIENGVLRHNPTMVASFLHSESTLSRAMVGEYLGDMDEFCNNVLKVGGTVFKPPFFFFSFLIYYSFVILFKCNFSCTNLTIFFSFHIFRST